MAKKLKVLELYSGIGGMHFSLKESEINYEVVAAADINTTANRIYQHNFPGTRLMTKCIEAIPLKQWNTFGMDMIVMSPPCQPFCRVGKQKDDADVRTKSFLYLLSLLPKLDKPVDYILVENVKGFDTSESRERLLETMTNLDFHVQEFLLSPLQFGIPNSRLRYYMIAKRMPLQFSFPVTNTIRTDIPDCVSEYLIHRRVKADGTNASHTNVHKTSITTKSKERIIKKMKGDFECLCITCTKREHSRESVINDTVEHAISDSSNEANSTLGGLCDNSKTDREDNTTKLDESHKSSYDSTRLDKSEDNDTGNKVECQQEVPLHDKYRDICGQIGDYLENENDEYFNKYLLEEKFFRRFWVMDLVTRESRNSCCFTKRYAHHMEGSGSIIEMNTKEAKDMSHLKAMQDYTDELHEAVRIRKLRYFSPREIANLMCFPPEFSFPADMKNIQMYRVLGNSLNVHVVAVLLRLLVQGDGHTSKTQ